MLAASWVGEESGLDLLTRSVILGGMSLLTLANVSKSFGPVAVLQGSLSLEQGEQIALVGPSGSGKSTLLHLISGVLRPDSGTVVVNGNQLTSLTEQQLDGFRARNIGYVFQTFHLLEGLTVLENVETAITFAGGKDYERARAALDEMGLQDRLNFFPSQLSVGQRQRVAVARAIVNQPPLILADEPTANLDAPRAQAVLQLLKQTCKSRDSALIVATHDQQAAAGFDRIVDFATEFKP